MRRGSAPISRTEGWRVQIQQIPDSWVSRVGSSLRGFGFEGGLFEAVLAQRREILASAYAQHPERFVRRAPQPAEPPTAVWINPPKHRSVSQNY